MSGVIDTEVSYIHFFGWCVSRCCFENYDVGIWCEKTRVKSKLEQLEHSKPEAEATNTIAR